MNKITKLVKAIKYTNLAAKYAIKGNLFLSSGWLSVYRWHLIDWCGYSDGNADLAAYKVIQKLKTKGIVDDDERKLIWKMVKIWNNGLEGFAP